MKKNRIASGDVISIPLLKDLGYAFCKYIDLTKLNSKILMPEVIKVYDLRSNDQSLNHSFQSTPYLLNPISVAGLLPTIKAGFWKVIGKVELTEDDHTIPDFKSGNSTWEESEKGEWFLHKHGQLQSIRASFEDVKYLQPFVNLSTSNIELRLTMYHLLNEKKSVKDYFDLSDERYKWHFKQVMESPSFRM
jgi:hypothetical protein